jgi:hypothetical protein
VTTVMHVPTAEAIEAGRSKHLAAYAHAKDGTESLRLHCWQFSLSEIAALGDYDRDEAWETPRPRGEPLNPVLATQTTMRLNSAGINSLIFFRGDWRCVFCSPALP